MPRKQLNINLSDTGASTGSRTMLSFVLPEYEEVLHAVSHDFQAPVNRIAALQALIAKAEAEHLSDFGKDVLERLGNNAAQLQHYTEDIVRFLQIAMGSFELEEFNLNELIDQILKAYSDFNQLQFDEQESYKLVANKRLIANLLTELLDNTRKYSTMPEVSIKLSKKDNVLCLKYEDTSQGYAPEYIADSLKLFKKLHADKSIKGTGAGLAICKLIVDRHQGQLKLETLPNKGMSYTIYLHNLRK